MGCLGLIALLALPGACQEPPSCQQKLERAHHRTAQLERVVQQLRSELDGLRPPFAALWHARGAAARQATTCGAPAMRAVLDDLRGRRPETHGEVWFPFEGGGFGNELNKYLAGCVLAIALNRTTQIAVGGASTIGLFEPRLGNWRSDSAPSGGNATTLEYRAAVACAPRACGPRFVPLVLTNTKPQPPAEDSDLGRKVHAHIKSIGASPPAWSDLLGCLSAEALRPAAPLADELRAYLNAARGRPLVGVHVRTTDRDMAIHMGNTGFLSRGQRLLGLDYTGSFRRKSGCVTDASAYGRCVAGLAAKAGDATYFVAGDAPSAVDAAAKAISRAAPNATVVATPGHPTHTGRVDHVQHANRTHHSGRTEGTLKALVDFMMLVASDVFLSNCPDGGSTFAWNVHTLRLGERTLYGRDARVCEGRLALGA